MDYKIIEVCTCNNTNPILCQKEYDDSVGICSCFCHNDIRIKLAEKIAKQSPIENDEEWADKLAESVCKLTD